ncbi:MAG: HK97 family phage prohead protease [Clostridia bacterium]|nr:HK97 family phage prohead protease [Clostridia bacterium]
MDREYRSMDMTILEGEEKKYMVEGYASTFLPYVLFNEDGVDYSERIDRHAFDEADLSDVVFRIDHEGPVYARTSAGTVRLDIDDHGLHNINDLSRTQRSRDVFEDIAAGNYPKMSFAFRVAPGGDHYEPETHTRVIDRIAKVFDISAVSFPANPTTNLSVSKRDWFDGVIERERAERLAAEERQATINRILSLMEDE